MADYSKEIEKRDQEPVKKKRRRRRAGEFSGRQIALKKIAKDGEKVFPLIGMWPPPFIQTVQEMRKALVNFAEGEEDVFTEDNATAMRVYFSKMLNVSGTVRQDQIILYPLFKLTL